VASTKRSKAAAKRRGPGTRPVKGPIVPEFRILERAACERVLSRNHVGRLAFALHDRVDIEPLHYVLVDGWLYGRTSLGSKLTALAHNHWVAFEVDEVDDVFDWRSVVVHGGWYTKETAAVAGTASWDRALKGLQRLVSGTLGKEDPVPFRWILFRIELAEVTGREAISRPAEPTATVRRARVKKRRA